MTLNRKGQSTAEYAIVIGLVVAVAAGVLGVALKGGIRQKNKEAMGFLFDAGSTEIGSFANTSERIFSADASSTTVTAAEYRDEKTEAKGGKTASVQAQGAETAAVSAEAMEDQNPLGP